VESTLLTKRLADKVQEQQQVGGLSMFSIIYWILRRSLHVSFTGEKTSRHAFLRQLAEELREVYKKKRKSMVPKHNEEEQSQNKEKPVKGISVQ
jgi:hypothetical protein